MSEEAFHSEEHDAWFLKVDGQPVKATAKTPRFALVDAEGESRRGRTITNLMTAVSILDAIEQVLAYAESTLTARDPDTNELLVEPWTLEQTIAALSSYRMDIQTLHTKLD